MDRRPPKKISSLFPPLSPPQFSVGGGKGEPKNRGEGVGGKEEKVGGGGGGGAAWRNVLQAKEEGGSLSSSSLPPEGGVPPGIRKGGGR